MAPDYTGSVIAKRQVEELAVRAAQLGHRPSETSRMWRA